MITAFTVATITVAVATSGVMSAFFYRRILFKVIIAVVTIALRVSFSGLLMVALLKLVFDILALQTSMGFELTLALLDLVFH